VSLNEAFHESIKLFKLEDKSEVFDFLNVIKNPVVHCEVDMKREIVIDLLGDDTEKGI
jgi:hypothetical protein